MPVSILRKKREEVGYDIKEISSILRIRPEFLKAIEDEEFEKLPVEVYAKGYIREYSKFLKVPADPVLNAYVQKMSPPKPEKTEIKETKKDKKPKTGYFVAAVIFAVIILAYVLMSSPPSETPVVKPEIPAPEMQLPQQPPIPEPESEQQMPEEPQPKKEEKPVPIQKHIIEIFARETTWLIINIDNSSTKDMILQPGESIKFEANRGFILKIGNAGGIKILYNKKDLGLLGEKGQVVDLSLPSDYKGTITSQS